MDTNTLTTLAGRFPLTAEARPPYPSLRQRITDLADLAGPPRRPTTDQPTEAAHSLAGSHQEIDHQGDAAVVLNKAALIASDCGLPELAHNLCLRHIDAYHATTHTPTPIQARYLLEPVLNLARLQLRAENGNAALDIMRGIYHAVTQHTDLLIEGRTLKLAHITGTRDQLYPLHQWSWRQYLTEGLRALTLNQRWDEAVAHATRLDGIGQHLLEGRQTLILYHLLNGRLDQARTTLTTSTITEAWEQQVSTCLRVLIAPDNDTAANDLRGILATTDRRQTGPAHAVYRARLGLTATSLAQAIGATDTATTILTTTADNTIATGDGYAARETSKHPHATAALTPDQHQALRTLTSASGLRAGHIPTELHHVLERAVTQAETTLHRPTLQPR